MTVNNELFEKYKELPSEFKHKLLDTLFDECFKQRDKLSTIRKEAEKALSQYISIQSAYNHRTGALEKILEVLDS